jgi:hypothetical protein
LGCSVVSVAKPALDRGSASDHATVRILDAPAALHSPGWVEALVAKLPDDVVAAIVGDLAEAVVATLLAEARQPDPVAEDQ